MVKIMLLTIGSRGDIQPFVALGKALESAGYDVALQTAEAYKSFVQGHGLTYLYMNNEFMQFIESKAGQAATESGGNKLSMMKMVMPMLRRMLEDEWQAAMEFQPDVLIYHPKSLGGYHLAEKLNIPFFQALALPLYTPTKDYPIPVISGVRLGNVFNRFSYKLMSLTTLPYMNIINDFRIKTLKLGKRGHFASELLNPNGEPVPILYSYSPHVLPVPADYPAHVYVTGYWFLDQTPQWQPPDNLIDFLSSGTPPVYVGFGSMSGTKVEERMNIVLEALQRSGQRGLLASGWGGLKANDPLPANVFMLEQAPHDWLFPRVSAVIHHGGAGTTAAGLRAGKPTIIVPFLADQPFWGSVIHELGVGPQPIPQKKLSVAALTDAINMAVNDTGVYERAEILGEKTRAENGTSNAVRIIAHEIEKWRLTQKSF